MNIQRALDGAGDLSVHPTVSALHIPSTIPVSHTFIPFQSFSGIPIPDSGNLRSRADDNNNKTVVSVVAAVSGLCPAIPVVSMQHQHQISQAVVAAPAIIPAVVAPVAVQTAGGKLAPGMSLGPPPPPPTTSNITLNCSVANLGPSDTNMSINSVKLSKLASVTSANIKSLGGITTSILHTPGNCVTSVNNGNSVSGVLNNPSNNMNPTPPSKINISNNSNNTNVKPPNNNTTTSSGQNPEQTDDLVKPVFKDGELVLEVECGQNKGILYLSKLCQGSKGPCISFQNSWLTPNEFQFVSGRETAKDWKRSIRHHGKSLKLLLAKGILNVHPTMCDCDGCRQGATLTRKGEKRRVPNGERKPRKPSSSNSNNNTNHNINNNNNLISVINNSAINNNGTNQNDTSQKNNTTGINASMLNAATNSGNTTNSNNISANSNATTAIPAAAIVSNNNSSIITTNNNSSTTTTVVINTNNATTTTINKPVSIGNGNVKNENHAPSFFRSPGGAIVPGQLSPGGVSIKPEMRRPGIDKTPAVMEVGAGYKPDTGATDPCAQKSSVPLASPTRFPHKDATTNVMAMTPTSTPTAAILFSPPSSATLSQIHQNGLNHMVQKTLPLSTPSLLSVPSLSSHPFPLSSLSSSLSSLPNHSTSSSLHLSSPTTPKRLHSVLSMINNSNASDDNSQSSNKEAPLNLTPHDAAEKQEITRMDSERDTSMELSDHDKEKDETVSRGYEDKLKVADEAFDVEDDNVEGSGDDNDNNRSDVSFDSSDDDDEDDCDDNDNGEDDEVDTSSSRLEIHIEDEDCESSNVEYDSSRDNNHNTPLNGGLTVSSDTSNTTVTGHQTLGSTETQSSLSSSSSLMTSTTSEVTHNTGNMTPSSSSSLSLSSSSSIQSSSSCSITPQSASSLSSKLLSSPSSTKSPQLPPTSNSTTPTHIPPSSPPQLPPPSSSPESSSTSSSELSPFISSSSSSSATMSVSSREATTAAICVTSLPNVKSEHIWVPPTLLPNPNSDNKFTIPSMHRHLLQHHHPSSFPTLSSSSSTSSTNPEYNHSLNIKSEENNNHHNTDSNSRPSDISGIKEEKCVSESSNSKQHQHHQNNNTTFPTDKPTHTHGAAPQSTDCPGTLLGKDVPKPSRGFTSIVEHCDLDKKDPGSGIPENRSVHITSSGGSIMLSPEEKSSREKMQQHMAAIAASEREREEQRLRQKSKEERARKEQRERERERDREREERREKEKRAEERESAEQHQRRRAEETSRRERELCLSRAQAESMGGRHDVTSSGPTLSMTPAMTLDPLGRPQGGVSEAAFSDYMRVLAASHGHSFLPPSPAAGLMHPMLHLRHQDPRIASSQFLNSLGAPMGGAPMAYFPKDPLIYHGAAAGVLPHGLQTAPPLPPIHPLLQRPPYAPAAAAQSSLLEYQKSIAAAAYGWPPGYSYLLSDLAGAAGASPSASTSNGAAVGMKRPSTEFEVAMEMNAKRMRLEGCRPPDLGAQWDYFAAAAAAQRSPMASLPCGLESNSMDKMSEALRKRYLEYMPQAAAYLSAIPAEYGGRLPQPVFQQCACAEHRDDDIRLWQVEDVCKFLNTLDGCAVYTDHFREQRVDGRILALLTTDHLTKSLGMKLGPAVLLCEAVAKKLQDLSKMHNCEACRSIAMSQTLPPLPLQL